MNNLHEHGIIGAIRNRRKTLMSLVICLKNNNSIVLASDSGELLLGNSISKLKVGQPKIESLIPSVWIASASNYATFADWIVSHTKEEIKRLKARHSQNEIDIKSVNGIASIFAQLVNKYHQAFMSDWLKDKQTPPEIFTEFIICGFTSEGMPKVNKFTNFDSSHPPFAPEEIKADYCLSGHPVIAQHYIFRLEKLIPISQMDTSSLERLAIFLINETKKADDEIKLPIKAVVLKHNMPTIEVSEDKVERIRKRMNRIVNDKKIFSAITKNGQPQLDN